MSPYTVQRNRHGYGYDVIRNAPTTVSIGLKHEEAHALALALNKQVRQIEAPPK